MATSLRRLKIREVSLCPVGANQKADVVLYKSHTEVQMFDIAKITDPVLRKMVEDEIKRISTELEASKAEAVTKATELTAASAQITELKKVAATPPAPAVDPLAGLSADMRKAFDTERNARIELEKNFNELKAKNALVETTAYVAKTFGAVAAHDNIAKVLVKLAPEDRAALETVLTSANERLAKLADTATKPIGSSAANTDPTDDPVIELDNLIKQEMEKNKVSYSVAFGTVQKTHRAVAERAVAPK